MAVYQKTVVTCDMCNSAVTITGPADDVDIINGTAQATRIRQTGVLLPVNWHFLDGNYLCPKHIVKVYDPEPVKEDV